METLVAASLGAGIDVVDLEGEEGREAGFVGMDPLRLTVSFNGGLGAYDVDDWLTEGKSATEHQGKRERTSPVNYPAIVRCAIPFDSSRREGGGGGLSK